MPMFNDKLMRPTTPGPIRQGGMPYNPAGAMPRPAGPMPVGAGGPMRPVMGSFHDGGTVPRDGVYELEAGEKVLTHQTPTNGDEAPGGESLECKSCGTTAKDGKCPSCGSHVLVAAQPSFDVSTIKSRLTNRSGY